MFQNEPYEQWYIRVKFHKDPTKHSIVAYKKMFREAKFTPFVPFKLCEVFSCFKLAWMKSIVQVFLDIVALWNSDQIT